MNETLARRLSLAGFPQDTSEFILRKYSLAKEPMRMERPPKDLDLAVLSGKLKWELAFPRLEEIMYELGDDFKSLFHFKDGWLAENGSDMEHFNNPYEALVHLYESKHPI